MELPRDIRLRILGYTDLVAPWKEVSWCRARRGYWITRVEHDDDEALHSPEVRHGYQFSQCSRPASPPHPSVGCFCRRRHAAFSSQCRCWVPPTALFLVCRALRAKDELVFYGSNRFVVVDGPSPGNPGRAWLKGGYPHPSFAASQFLRDFVPRHCLNRLRSVELVFSPFHDMDRGWPPEGHLALQVWAELIHIIGGELNLPGLTLRVVMAGVFDHPPAEGLWEGMTNSRGSRVVDA